MSVDIEDDAQIWRVRQYKAINFRVCSEPKWGRYLWQHNGGKNIYGRPALTDKCLIYAAGDSYNWKEKGVVYLLNRKDGTELYKFETPNATFSSPVIVGDKVVFGCLDGLIYCLQID